MKKIFTSLIIFIIFFELLSVVFTHLDLFVFNERPKYSYEKKFLHDWIEKDNDGIVWHKKIIKLDTFQDVLMLNMKQIMLVRGIITIILKMILTHLSC